MVSDHFNADKKHFGTDIAANPNEIFCIAIGDIDFFKSVNDTYGHDCGDLVLQELSALFKDKTMGKGNVCRWGG